MFNKSKVKESQRFFRHKRLRKRITGTPERPRLCVHRSLKNLYAHLVDDTNGRVLCGLSTLNKGIKKSAAYGGNIKGAAALGEAMATLVKEKGIQRVSFDRGGYLYHGRVKAFAEAARKGGLEF